MDTHNSRMETRADVRSSHGQPPLVARSTFAEAIAAYHNRQYRTATLKLVLAFAYCKASVPCFQVLLMKNNNMQICNEVTTKYTDCTSVDRQVLLMALASADQDAPGTVHRLQTLKNSTTGICSSSFILAVLVDRHSQDLGEHSNMEQLRVITRWKIHHFRAIFFSRMYSMRLTKKDLTIAYQLMVAGNDQDPELERDYREYNQYRGEMKYGCAICGKVGRLFKCTECEVLSYCGKECQVVHWKGGHRDTCKFLKHVQQALSM